MGMTNLYFKNNLRFLITALEQLKTSAPRNEIAVLKKLLQEDLEG